MFGWLKTKMNASETHNRARNIMHRDIRSTRPLRHTRRRQKGAQTTRNETEEEARREQLKKQNNDKGKVNQNRRKRRE